MSGILDDVVASVSGVVNATPVGTVVNTVCGILPDILKRVLPAEKMTDLERARLTADIQNAVASQNWNELEAAYADVNSARNLAGQDLAKGNAFTGSLSALVRPLWGIGAFVMTVYYVVSHVPIEPPTTGIIETVIGFYFGSRLVEKVTPHVAAALSK